MDVGIDMMKGRLHDGIDVSPGMIGPVDDGPSCVGVSRAASKPCIPIVRGLPVGRIVLVKRHLVWCLLESVKSALNNRRARE